MTSIARLIQAFLFGFDRLFPLSDILFREFNMCLDLAFFNLLEVRKAIVTLMFWRKPWQATYLKFCSPVPFFPRFLLDGY